MERDALISHGAAFVVRDRLLACSDICSADLCSTCGSMLTSQRVAPSPTATTLQQVKSLNPFKNRMQIVLPQSLHSDFLLSARYLSILRYRRGCSQRHHPLRTALPRLGAGRHEHKTGEEAPHAPIPHIPPPFPPPCPHVLENGTCHN